MSDEKKFSETEFADLNFSAKLINFEGKNKLERDGRMISVIVVFMHKPPKLEQILNSGNQDFNFSKAEREAKQDCINFINFLNDAYQKNLKDQGSKKNYKITSFFNITLNGVAITLPDIYVEKLAALDYIAYIYPDEVTALDFNKDSSMD